MLLLQTGDYEITIDSDQTYTPGSADNNSSYSQEYRFGEYRPASRHSIRVTQAESEVASCILLADGGATGVHEHSALVHSNSCVVAVGPYLCSLRLPDLSLNWHTQVDSASCFGVYTSDKHKCYISHGEIEVARVTHHGQVLWAISGKDIFTNGFVLSDDQIEVIDWNNEVYQVDIASGKSRLTTT